MGGSSAMTLTQNQQLLQVAEHPDVGRNSAPDVTDVVICKDLEEWRPITCLYFLFKI